MSDELKIPHYAKKLLAKLETGQGLLCRTSADTDEAVTKGGGYLYFIEPGGKKASPASAKILIDSGLVSPQPDGLFDGISQTFRVAQNAA